MRVFRLRCLLIWIVSVAGDTSAETLRYHTLVVDAQDKILPWYAPAGNAFDNYLDKCWAWAVAAPNDAHGLPISFLYCSWNPGNPPSANTGWENDVGEKIPNWVESARLYYQYSGNKAPLDYVKGLVDYSLDHGQTPTNHVWPAFPVGTSNAGDTEFRSFTGVRSLWDCHVDLAADIGFSMYRMYQMYGDTRYRDKAIHVADLLVTNMVTGTATNSPWPYVINSQTGANQSRYAASWDGALELFDLLIENNHGNVASYVTARTALKNWLLTYPMQNGNWVDGHSDVKIQGTNNWSTTCGSDMCLYLLDHPGWDPNFTNDVPKLLKWTEDNFVNVSTPDGLAGQYHGAYVPAEQIAYMYRMGYQTARLGAQYAGWYAVTGDTTYKDRAYRCLAYNTYMMQDNGQSSDGPTDTVGFWWSDCYGEATRMYYYGLAAVPEWAPADENHLLHSTSIVKSITYSNTVIAYTTWTNAATETFRLAATPTNVVGGTWSFDATTGVLRVTHTLTNQIQVLLVPAPPIATVAIDGTQTAQTIDGFGVNANHRSWNGTELQPVLDALIDQAGMTLFRVVFDETDWEATNDNTNSAVMNWTYYNTVYGSNTFTCLWDMTAYLNSRGLTNGVFFNFMGRGPAWLGGGTITAGKEDEWAEMIASLLVYARTTRGLQFKLVAPDNEPDIANEGITMGATQYTNCLHKLALQLDANGLNDVQFVAPDRAGGGIGYLPEMLADPVIMAKLAHFGVHSYSSGGGGSGGVYDFLAGTGRNFWMTEFNVWCNTCDSGTRGTYDWNYCRGTADYLLNHLANGAAGGIIWEGYDSLYLHPPSAWSFWGLFSVDNENVTPKTYTPRKNFYTVAQISKFVRPGARRVAVTGNTAPFAPLLAFQRTGAVTITGINTTNTAAILTGTLTQPVPNLTLYYTSATTNLAYGGSFPVSNGTFSATIPADCVFTMTGAAAISVAITNPANGAAFSPPATIPIQAMAATTNASITQVQFFNGATLLGTDTTAPYSFTWNNVSAGTYALTARATDNIGLVATSAVVNVTVATTGGGTIGNTTDGTSSDNIWDNGAWINACRHVAASNMVVTTMRAKVAALTGHYKCAIYADDYRLLCSTSEITNPATNGWYDFPLTSSVTLTNGNFYWVAIWSDAAAARVYYNGTGSLSWGRYDYGAWPNPIAFTSNGSYNYCLYATGTAPPSAYDTWKAGYGLTGAADTSDTDGDGIPLLLDYALGLNPTMANTTGITLTKSGESFLFTYQRPANRPGITYAVEDSPDLTPGSWTTSGVTHTRIATGDPETWQASYDITGLLKLFFRLKVTQP